MDTKNATLMIGFNDFLLLFFSIFAIIFRSNFEMYCFKLIIIAFCENKID